MKKRPQDMNIVDKRRDYTKHLMDYFSIKKLYPCPKCKGEVYLRSCSSSNRKLVKCMNCGYNKVDYSHNFTDCLLGFYLEG